MAEFTRGNKLVFPESAGNNYPESRENEIVSRTQRLMFAGNAIDNPATTYGGGIRNSFGAMCGYGPKSIQESYRSGLSRSRESHESVVDR